MSYYTFTMQSILYKKKISSIQIIFNFFIVDIKMLSLQGKISGDIHFDDDEYWTLGSYSGVNLTQVDG